MRKQDLQTFTGKGGAKTPHLHRHSLRHTDVTVLTANRFKKLEVRERCIGQLCRPACQRFPDFLSNFTTLFSYLNSYASRIIAASYHLGDCRFLPLIHRDLRVA